MLNIIYDNANMVQCLQEEVASNLQERIHRADCDELNTFYFCR